MHGPSQGSDVIIPRLEGVLTRPILDRPLRPERLLPEEKGEALREGGRPCVAMPSKMACRMANTLALEFSSRTFTCHDRTPGFRGCLKEVFTHHGERV